MGPRFFDVEFVVSVAPIIPCRRPVIGLDGPVQGADLCFDHHMTGEPVNLLAIPDPVPFPAVLATTMLDSDAVLSAAVVLLRATGEGAEVARLWPTLHEAAHYCDHLVPSGQYPGGEEAGLGLHCWLKERGFALTELLAWQADDLRDDGMGGLQPTPSRDSQGSAFRALTLAIVSGLRRGVLPSDRGYLERLGAMAADARRVITQMDGRVTVLVPSTYIDPLAIYRVVTTDLIVLMRPARDGTVHYSLGVHPRAYGRIDLGRILPALAEQEPGWGGRGNAGGSPLGAGSRIPLRDLLGLLNSHP